MTSLIMTADKIGLTFVADWFTKLSAKRKAKQVQKRTVAELSRLSNHELNDIGISRGMIGQAAWEAYQIELKQQLRKHGGVV